MIAGWITYEAEWIDVAYIGIAVAVLLLIVRLTWSSLGKKRRTADHPANSGINATSSSTRAKVLPSASSSALSVEESSWNGRRLFADLMLHTGEQENALPTVSPDENPHVGTHDYAFGGLTPILAALLPESPARRAAMQQTLMAAGFYQPHAWQNLAAYRYLAIMASFVLFGAMIVLVPREAELAMALMLVTMCVLGWALPGLYIRSKANDRTSEIERAMPDMIDMLDMCVSQGLTVSDSFMRVSRELKPVYPALAQELAIVCEQAQVGTMKHALENFAARIDVPEVHAFTSLLIQTETMGTSVSLALNEHSDNMREGLRQRADEKANRATFKLLFPTVLCLMPAVYLFLLGPAVVELTDFFYGGGRDVLDTGRNALEQINR